MDPFETDTKEPPRRSFFKSAAAPIVGVVILAFFAQKFINHGNEYQTPIQLPKDTTELPTLGDDRRFLVIERELGKFSCGKIVKEGVSGFVTNFDETAIVEESNIPGKVVVTCRDVGERTAVSQQVFTPGS